MLGRTENQAHLLRRIFRPRRGNVLRRFHHVPDNRLAVGTLQFRFGGTLHG